MASATVDRKAFLGALVVLKRLTKCRCTIPALACLRITAKGAEVEIAATDLEAFGKFKFRRLAGEGDFVRAIPSDRILQLVRTNKASTLTIEEADVSSATVDGVTLEGLPIEDYPVIPDAESVVGAVVPAKAFAEGMKAAGFCVSSEVVRYALTGIHLNGGPKGKGLHGVRLAADLNVVTSDGKQLVWQVIHSADVKMKFSTIAPEKTVRAIQGLAEAADPKAKVEVLFKLEGGKKKQEVTGIQFRFGDGLIGSKIVEGRFPDYQAVVPKVEGGWVIGRKALLKALADIWPVLTDKTMAARFTLADGKLEVFSRSQDIGEAKSVLPVKGTTDSLEVTLNPQYVREYLKALPDGCERVRFLSKAREAGKEATATLWLAEGVKGHTYVLMPLTITWPARGAQQPAETEVPADETKPAQDETKAPVEGTKPAPDETVEAPATDVPTEAPPAGDADSVEKDMPKPASAPEEEVTSFYGSMPEEGA